MMPLTGGGRKEPECSKAYPSAQGAEHMQESYGILERIRPGIRNLVSGLLQKIQKIQEQDTHGPETNPGASPLDVLPGDSKKEPAIDALEKEFSSFRTDIKAAEDALNRPDHDAAAALHACGDAFLCLEKFWELRSSDQSLSGIRELGRCYSALYSFLDEKIPFAGSDLRGRCEQKIFKCNQALLHIDSKRMKHLGKSAEYSPKDVNEALDDIENARSKEIEKPQVAVLKKITDAYGIRRVKDLLLGQQAGSSDLARLADLLKNELNHLSRDLGSLEKESLGDANAQEWEKHSDAVSIVKLYSLQKLCRDLSCHPSSEYAKDCGGIADLCLKAIEDKRTCVLYDPIAQNVLRVVSSDVIRSDSYTGEQRARFRRIYALSAHQEASLIAENGTESCRNPGKSMEDLLVLYRIYRQMATDKASTQRQDSLWLPKIQKIRETILEYLNRNGVSAPHNLGEILREMHIGYMSQSLDSPAGAQKYRLGTLDLHAHPPEEIPGYSSPVSLIETAENIFFDIDDTLVSAYKAHDAGLKACLKILNDFLASQAIPLMSFEDFKKEALEAYMNEGSGHMELPIIEGIIRKAGPKPDRELAKEMLEVYEKDYWENLEVCPGETPEETPGCKIGSLEEIVLAQEKESQNAAGTKVTIHVPAAGQSVSDYIREQKKNNPFPGTVPINIYWSGRKTGEIIETITPLDDVLAGWIEKNKIPFHEKDGVIYVSSEDYARNDIPGAGMRIWDSAAEKHITEAAKKIESGLFVAPEQAKQIAEQLVRALSGSIIPRASWLDAADILVCRSNPEPEVPGLERSVKEAVYSLENIYNAKYAVDSESLLLSSETHTGSEWSDALSSYLYALLNLANLERDLYYSTGALTHGSQIYEYDAIGHYNQILRAISEEEHRAGSLSVDLQRLASAVSLGLESLEEAGFEPGDAAGREDANRTTTNSNSIHGAGGVRYSPELLAKAREDQLSGSLAVSAGMLEGIGWTILSPMHSKEYDDAVSLMRLVFEKNPENRIMAIHVLSELDSTIRGSRGSTYKKSSLLDSLESLGLDTAQAIKELQETEPTEMRRGHVLFLLRATLDVRYKKDAMAALYLLSRKTGTTLFNLVGECVSILESTDPPDCESIKKNAINAIYDARDIKTEREGMSSRQVIELSNKPVSEIITGLSAYPDTQLETLSEHGDDEIRAAAKKLTVVLEVANRLQHGACRVKGAQDWYAPGHPAQTLLNMGVVDVREEILESSLDLTLSDHEHAQKVLDGRVNGSSVHVKVVRPLVLVSKKSPGMAYVISGNSYVMASIIPENLVNRNMPEYLTKILKTDKKIKATIVEITGPLPPGKQLRAVIESELEAVSQTLPIVRLNGYTTKEAWNVETSMGRQNLLDIFGKAAIRSKKSIMESFGADIELMIGISGSPNYMYEDASRIDWDERYMDDLDYTIVRNSESVSLIDDVNIQLVVYEELAKAFNEAGLSYRGTRLENFPLGGGATRTLPFGKSNVTTVENLFIESTVNGLLYDPQFETFAGTEGALDLLREESKKNPMAAEKRLYMASTKISLSREEAENGNYRKAMMKIAQAAQIMGMMNLRGNIRDALAKEIISREAYMEFYGAYNEAKDANYITPADKVEKYANLENQLREYNACKTSIALKNVLSALDQFPKKESGEYGIICEKIISAVKRTNADQLDLLLSDDALRKKVLEDAALEYDLRRQYKEPSRGLFDRRTKERNPDYNYLKGEDGSKIGRARYTAENKEPSGITAKYLLNQKLEEETRNRFAPSKEASSKLDLAFQAENTGDRNAARLMVDRAVESFKVALGVYLSIKDSSSAGRVGYKLAENAYATARIYLQDARADAKPGVLYLDSADYCLRAFGGLEVTMSQMPDGLSDESAEKLSLLSDLLDTVIDITDIFGDACIDPNNSAHDYVNAHSGIFHAGFKDIGDSLQVLSHHLPEIETLKRSMNDALDALKAANNPMYSNQREPDPLFDPGGKLEYSKSAESMDDLSFPGLSLNQSKALRLAFQGKGYGEISRLIRVKQGGLERILKPLGKKGLIKEMKGGSIVVTPDGVKLLSDAKADYVQQPGEEDIKYNKLARIKELFHKEGISKKEFEKYTQKIKLHEIKKQALKKGQKFPVLKLNVRERKIENVARKAAKLSGYFILSHTGSDKLKEDAARLKKDLMSAKLVIPTETLEKLAESFSNAEEIYIDRFLEEKLRETGHFGASLTGYGYAENIGLAARRICTDGLRLSSSGNIEDEAIKELEALNVHEAGIHAVGEISHDDTELNIHELSRRLVSDMIPDSEPIIEEPLSDLGGRIVSMGDYNRLSGKGQAYLKGMMQEYLERFLYRYANAQTSNDASAGVISFLGGRCPAENKQLLEPFKKHPEMTGKIMLEWENGLIDMGMGGNEYTEIDPSQAKEILKTGLTPGKLKEYGLKVRDALAISQRKNRRWKDKLFVKKTGGTLEAHSEADVDKTEIFAQFLDGPEDIKITEVSSGNLNKAFDKISGDSRKAEQERVNFFIHEVKYDESDNEIISGEYRERIMLNFFYVKKFNAIAKALQEKDPEGKSLLSHLSDYISDEINAGKTLQDFLDDPVSADLIETIARKLTSRSRESAGRNKGPVDKLDVETRKGYVRDYFTVLFNDASELTKRKPLSVLIREIRLDQIDTEAWVNGLDQLRNSGYAAIVPNLNSRTRTLGGISPRRVLLDYVTDKENRGKTFEGAISHVISRNEGAFLDAVTLGVPGLGSRDAKRDYLKNALEALFKNIVETEDLYDAEGVEETLEDIGEKPAELTKEGIPATTDVGSVSLATWEESVKKFWRSERYAGIGSILNRRRGIGGPSGLAAVLGYAADHPGASLDDYRAFFLEHVGTDPSAERFLDDVFNSALQSAGLEAVPGEFVQETVLTEGDGESAKSSEEKVGKPAKTFDIPEPEETGPGAESVSEPLEPEHTQEEEQNAEKIAVRLHIEEVLSSPVKASFADIKEIVKNALEGEKLTFENAVNIIDYTGRSNQADALSAVELIGSLGPEDLALLEGVLYGSDGLPGMLAIDREMHPESASGDLTGSETAVSRMYPGGILFEKTAVQVAMAVYEAGPQPRLISMSPLLGGIVVQVSGLHLGMLSSEIHRKGGEASIRLNNGKTALLSFAIERSGDDILLKTEGKTFIVTGAEAGILADTCLSPEGVRAFNKRTIAGPAKKREKKKEPDLAAAQVPLLNSSIIRRLTPEEAEKVITGIADDFQFSGIIERLEWIRSSGKDLSPIYESLEHAFYGTAKTTGLLERQRNESPDDFLSPAEKALCRLFTAGMLFERTAIDLAENAVECSKKVPNIFYIDALHPIFKASIGINDDIIVKVREAYPLGRYHDFRFQVVQRMGLLKAPEFYIQIVNDRAVSLSYMGQGKKLSGNAAKKIFDLIGLLGAVKRDEKVIVLYRGTSEFGLNSVMHNRGRYRPGFPDFGLATEESIIRAILRSIQIGRIADVEESKGGHKRDIYEADLDSPSGGMIRIRTVVDSSTGMILASRPLGTVKDLDKESARPARETRPGPERIELSDYLDQFEDDSVKKIKELITGGTIPVIYRKNIAVRCNEIQERNKKQKTKLIKSPVEILCQALVSEYEENAKPKELNLLAEGIDLRAVRQGINLSVPDFRSFIQIAAGYYLKVKDQKEETTRLREKGLTAPGAEYPGSLVITKDGRKLLEGFFLGTEISSSDSTKNAKEKDAGQQDNGIEGQRREIRARINGIGGLTSGERGELFQMIYASPLEHPLRLSLAEKCVKYKADATPLEIFSRAVVGDEPAGKIRPGKNQSVYLSNILGSYYAKRTAGIEKDIDQKVRFHIGSTAFTGGSKEFAATSWAYTYTCLHEMLFYVAAGYGNIVQKDDLDKLLGTINLFRKLAGKEEIVPATGDMALTDEGIEMLKDYVMEPSQDSGEGLAGKKGVIIRGAGAGHELDCPLIAERLNESFGLLVKEAKIQSGGDPVNIAGLVSLDKAVSLIGPYHLALLRSVAEILDDPKGAGPLDVLVKELTGKIGRYYSGTYSLEAAIELLEFAMNDEHFPGRIYSAYSTLDIRLPAPYIADRMRYTMDQLRAEAERRSGGDPGKIAGCIGPKEAGRKITNNPLHVAIIQGVSGLERTGQELTVENIKEKLSESQKADISDETLGEFINYALSDEEYLENILAASSYIKSIPKASDLFLAHMRTVVDEAEKGSHMNAKAVRTRFGPIDYQTMDALMGLSALSAATPADLKNQLSSSSSDRVADGKAKEMLARMQGDADFRKTVSKAYDIVHSFDLTLIELAESDIFQTIGFTGKEASEEFSMFRKREKILSLEINTKERQLFNEMVRIGVLERVEIKPQNGKEEKSLIKRVSGKMGSGSLETVSLQRDLQNKNAVSAYRVNRGGLENIRKKISESKGKSKKRQIKNSWIEDEQCIVLIKIMLKSGISIDRDITAEDFDLMRQKATGFRETDFKNVKVTGYNSRIVLRLLKGASPKQLCFIRKLYCIDEGTLPLSKRQVIRKETAGYVSLEFLEFIGIIKIKSGKILSIDKERIEKFFPEILANKQSIYRDILLARGINHNSFDPLGKGSPLLIYLNIRQPQVYSFIPTSRINKNDFPAGYSTFGGLKAPALHEKVEISSLNDLPGADLMKVDEAFLVSESANKGTEAVARLGTLEVDGRPVAVRTYAQSSAYFHPGIEKILINDYKAAVLFDELGIGPKMHGVYRRTINESTVIAGNVTDIVPGDYPYSPAGKKNINLDTVKDLIKACGLIVSKGYAPGCQFEYFVAQDGHIRILPNQNSIRKEIHYSIDPLDDGAALNETIKLLEHAPRKVIMEAFNSIPRLLDSIRNNVESSDEPNPNLLDAIRSADTIETLSDNMQGPDHIKDTDHAPSVIYGIDAVKYRCAILADAALGLSDMPQRSILIEPGDGSCYDSPEEGVSRIYVNAIPMDKAAAALLKMRSRDLSFVDMEPAGMKSMLETCIYSHEVVHSRIRAHSNSLGDGVHQCLTDADRISEGLAAKGMVEVLEMLVFEKLQEQGISKKEKTCLNALLQVAKHFEELRPLIGIESNREYGLQMAEVRSGLEAGISLSQIYDKKLASGRITVTGITTKQLVALESMNDLEALYGKAKTSLLVGRYPETEIAAMLSTLAYANDLRMRAKADDALVELYTMNRNEPDAPGKKKTYAQDLKGTAEEMFAFRPGMDG
ncbi:MAG: hypothetical protein WAX07_07240 [Candidatus Altiarchaeia archaeon]